MKFSNIRFTSILLINILCVKSLNAQRSSNGRHRTWWSSEEEPPQSSLTINDDLIINQNVPFRKEKINLNNSIVVNLEDHSINLTPEPLAAEIVKVDLNIDKSAMFLASRPTYLLRNHSDKEASKKEDENLNNEKNINFVATKRMLNPNSASKHCLSTLDCDLELNERCLSPDSEEVLFYDQLIKLQAYTSVYSQYLRKKWKKLKTTKSAIENAFERLENEKNSDQPICGCSSPSFIRNQVTGQCELMRAVELRFKIIVDRITANVNVISEQNFEQQSNNQIKLDALGQIDHVIKNSDSLQDIVHHFRLTKLTPLTGKNRKSMFANENSEENFENKTNSKKKRRSTSSMVRMKSQFIARGLLFLFSSEYTTSFDQLFTNEYCSTQNTLRLKAQEKMFHQTLSATNQTIRSKHTNTIRSADFWHLFNKNDNNTSLLIEDNLNQNQSDRMKYMNLYLKNRNRSENKLTEMMPSFIYHRKKRQTRESNDERYGLDVQLIEVNSDKINICALSADYATEQLNEARRKYQFDKRKDGNSSEFAEQIRKKLDYERKFFRLTYCDTQRAFCESLPRSRAGYICVCHGNLMDLSPIPAQDQIPAEYCGIKCNLDCGKEGFCHVRNSVGNYPSPDYDLAAQQRFLSTAGRMLSFKNGKLLNEKKKEDNSSKLEKEDESELELIDYQSLLDAHKKNQTLLKQRYYAAIYSVQQRFAQLFENMDSGSSKSIKDSKTDNEKSKFDYTYSFVQTPQLVTFYCTCPGWAMGNRCQFSGWMILLVLGILVILFALVTICTVSWLCAPIRSKRKDSNKSNKSNLNTTTSLTISDTSDSLDIETSSQQFNSSSQSNHHNQFNNQLNRQRRASEFVNDRRSSFGLSNNQDNKTENNNKPITKPEFNLIHATPPPHSAKETQKIQFTDTITEIPYDLPYEREIAQISSKVQQQIPTSTYNTASYTQQMQKSSRIPINLDRLLKRDDNERRFEFYDSPNRVDNHIYNVIADNQNDPMIAIENKPYKKESATQTPISHVHNVYASAGELRVEREDLPSSNDLQQIERRSIGSQTSGFQSGDPSLAYLSAISLKQLQSEQQHKKVQQKANQLPTISGPIVWF